MQLSDIAAYLPTIATAIANPALGIAQLAAQFLGPKIGCDPSVEAVTQKLAGFGPDDIVKLKDLDNQLQVHLSDNNISLDKDALADTEDARARDLALQKLTGKPNYVAISMYILVVLGLIGLMYIVLESSAINDFAKGVITFGLGRLWGYLDTIFQFEYGSTRSSRTKDDTINKLSG